MTDPLAARIAALAATAPPLTEQQRHRVRQLVGPTLRQLTPLNKTKVPTGGFADEN